MPARQGETATDAAGSRIIQSMCSRLCSTLREADVVIDASASTEVQLALAHYCKIRRTVRARLRDALGGGRFGRALPP